MKTLTSRPMASWIIWAGGLLTVFLILTWQFFVTGVMTDKSGISQVIIALFVLGLIQSFRAAAELDREWGVFRKIKTDKNVPAADGKEGLCDLMSRVADLRSRGVKVDLDNFMNIYYARHDSRAQTVATFGALLITLGLLGTIVGLIISIQGLSGMIENMTVSRSDMLASLRQTLAGMGTAFYTTFFGALLGGIILRILSANLMNALEELAAEALEFCELYVLPGTGNQADQWEKRLAAMTESFAGMVRQVDGLSTQLGQSINSLVQQLNDAGKSIHTSVTESLSGMTRRVDGLGEQLGESVSGLVEQINSAGQDVHKMRAQQLETETRKVAGQLAATAEVLKKISFSSEQPPRSAE